MFEFFSKTTLKQRVFFGALIIWSAIYFFIAIGNHFLFKTHGFDYGLFNNIIWKYAHFQVDCPYFNVPLINALQDHFSLTLFFLVPVYWITGWLTGSYTLLIIQVIFVIIGALGTYKWVKLKTDNEWISQVALNHFFALFGVLSVVGNDYHDIVLGACLVPYFLYYLESTNLWKSLIILVFIITCKENMPIIMTLLLLVYLISDWKNLAKRKNILIFITISFTYTLILFLWLVPLVAVPGRDSWVFKYYHLGNSIKEVAIFLITHPKVAFIQLFVNHSSDVTYDWVKTEFYLAFFIFWGGIALLLKPKYFILFIPLIAQKVYSDLPLMWSIYAYYSIEICVLLAGAVFISLASLKQMRLIKILSVLVLVLNLGFTIHILTGGAQVKWMVDRSKIAFFDKSFYKNTGDLEYYEKLKKVIPEKQSLSCTQKLSTHFSGREKITVFPIIRDYNYIAIDTLDSYPLKVEEINSEKMRLINSGEWKTIFCEGRFIVLEKKDK